MVGQPLDVNEPTSTRPLHATALLNHASILLAAAFAAMIAFFWPGLAWLTTAWERPEYSHGYLIPLIALFLFLRQLRNDPPPIERPAGWRLGLVTVLFGLLVGLLGNSIQAPGLTVYGFVICMAGLVLTAMGTTHGLRFWAPIFYLAFMLPLPTVLYWQLSLRLQTISSQLGVWFVSSLGIPVLLQGNIIDLGNFQLQVAEACSGLRYLFPLASFGFLFAVLYQGPFWHRLVLFLSTLPITVLMNSFRIGVIAILVDNFGIAQAEGFLHAFEGWIIFVACVVLLYLAAILLQRFAPNPQPIGKMLEIDFSGIRPALKRLGEIRGSTAIVSASVAIIATALAWYTVPRAPLEPPNREPLVLFPAILGDWTGRQTLLAPEIEAVLTPDDYLVADYAGPSGSLPINLFVAYYKSQIQHADIHSPEVCIPSGGWEVSGWSTFGTGVMTASGTQLSVNRAIIQKGGARQLVYYWFQERERALTNDYAAKAWTLWDAITRHRSDGALWRVITPIDDRVSVEVADSRLRAFLQLALPELPKFVPG